MFSPIGSTNYKKKELHALACSQHGYFLAGQAIACGYGSQHHAYHVKVKNWLSVSRGIFRLPGFPDSLEADAVRWTLWSRNHDNQPQGVVSHATALALHGLIEHAPPAIHLVVPNSFRKKVPPEVVIHKGILKISAIESRGCLMLTRLGQTFCDLQADLSPQNPWSGPLRKALAEGRLSAEELTMLGISPPMPAGTIKSDLIVNPASGQFLDMFSATSGLDCGPESGEFKFDSVAEGVWKMIFERTATGRRRSRAGFTLVELLVVTAIISVLAGMLLPALEKALNSARQIGCVSVLKQYALANVLYQDNFNGWNIPVFAGDVTKRTTWFAQEFFRSSLSLRKGPPSQPNSTDYWPAGLVCPNATLARNEAVDGFPRISRAYGNNATDPNPAGSGAFIGVWATVNYRGFQISQIKNPGGKLQWVDATDWQVAEIHSDAANYYYIVGEYYDASYNGMTAYRHSDGANVGYFDGHAAYTRTAAVSRNGELWRMQK